MLAGARLHAG